MLVPKLGGLWGLSLYRLRCFTSHICIELNDLNWCDGSGSVRLLEMRRCNQKEEKDQYRRAGLLNFAVKDLAPARYYLGLLQEPYGHERQEVGRDQAFLKLEGPQLGLPLPDRLSDPEAGS